MRGTVLCMGWTRDQAAGGGQAEAAGGWLSGHLPSVPKAVRRPPHRTAGGPATESRCESKLRGERGCQV